MITFAILILIVAKALPGLNTHISSIHVTRITSIVFLFAGALSLNSLNLESIGSGIGIYSGLFQVTSISQLIEIFLFMIGGGILIAWPQIKYNLYLPLTPSAGPALQGKAQLHLSPTAVTGTAVSATASPSSKAGVAVPLPHSCGWVSCEGEESDLEKFTLFLTDKHSTDYSLVVLFSSLGSSLLISSYDLISVYLSIELQSFGLYVLSTLYRDSESSTSAGLKYFLLGGLSSCIILLGTGIIYSYTGTTNLESLYIINSVIDVNQQYIIMNNQCISLGLSLIFIGFLFKIAAAPLHNWSPDVYDGTPTIVTTWLTIIPKIAILFILLELQVKLGSFGLGGSNYFPLPYAPLELDPSFNSLGGGAPMGGIAELKTIIINSSGYPLKTLLLISATLSLIIGSLLGLAQIKIKRLLAYSTISHIGFILLALAVNTEQSIDSFIFYIIQYTITNLNIFLVILGLTYCLPSSEGAATLRPGLSLCKAVGVAKLGINKGNKDISFISEFKGLFFSNPLLSLSLAVSLFSMAGIPPLIGFFSKQLVLYSALQNGYYFISVLAIIVSVISCSYYLQIIKILLTKSTSIGALQHSPSCYSEGGIGPATASPSPQLGQLLGVGKAGPSPLEGEANHSLSVGAVISGTEGVAAPTPIPSPSAKQSEVYWREKNKIILTNTHSYLISTLTFTILLFFIKPSLILNSTQLLSLSLFYI
jgi:NADH-ubiquinone oxidoreductase chain 2